MALARRKYSRAIVENYLSIFVSVCSPASVCFLYSTEKWKMHCLARMLSWNGFFIAEKSGSSSVYVKRLLKLFFSSGCFHKLRPTTSTLSLICCCILCCCWNTLIKTKIAYEIDRDDSRWLNFIIAFYDRWNWDRGRVEGSEKKGTKNNCGW